jgi:hypothetical protein
MSDFSLEWHLSKQDVAFYREAALKRGVFCEPVGPVGNGRLKGYRYSSGDLRKFVEFHETVVALKLSANLAEQEAEIARLKEENERIRKAADEVAEKAMQIAGDLDAEKHAHEQTKQHLAERDAEIAAIGEAIEPMRLGSETRATAVTRILQELAEYEDSNAKLIRAAYRISPFPPKKPHSEGCGCSGCELMEAIAQSPGEALRDMLLAARTPICTALTAPGRYVERGDDETEDAWKDRAVAASIDQMLKRY